jgi:hypothetical protein
MRFSSAFIEKDFRMVSPPFSLPLSVFSQDYSEADAGASLAVFAFRTQAKHPVA